MLLDDQDKDLENLSLSLHNAGYIMLNSHKKERYIHRIVLSRKLGRELKKGEMCDHINRNKQDNRRDNLRIADKSINSVNRNMRPDNTTGYVGVYKHNPKEWQKKGWKPSYLFTIWRKGHKVFYSKYYKTSKEAHEARLEKLKEYTY